MTLDEIAREFRWDPLHDYGSALRENGKIVAVHELGIWEEDLARVMASVPDLQVLVRHRVRHDQGDWLRVDLQAKSRP